MLKEAPLVLRLNAADDVVIACRDLEPDTVPCSIPSDGTATFANIIQGIISLASSRGTPDMPQGQGHRLPPQPAR